MKKFNSFLAITFAAAVGLTLALTAVSSAATTYNGGGNLVDAGSWTAGVPTAGNDGVINTSGTITSSFGGFSAGTIVNQTAGDIDFGTRTFNMQNGTWNLSGGSFSLSAGPNQFDGQWTPNGAAVVFNISGGTLTNTALVNGPLNGARMTFSGAGVAELAAFWGGVNGTLDFQTGWSGSFTVDTYSAALWESLFTTGNGNLNGTLNGGSIDAATFNSTFQVTNGGTTLAPFVIPEPSTFVLAALGLLGLLGWGRRRRR